MNTELLNMVISDIKGKDFSYLSFEKQEMKTVFIKNKDSAIEMLRDALGYEDKTSVYKVLSGETKCPRKDKMETLQKMFGVSFYQKKTEDSNKRKDVVSMILNEVSKKAMLDMYSATIDFFNTAVDCVEEIDEHLRELDKYRLGIPAEIFDKYITSLKELVYNLPVVDCTDILEEENVIPDEESLHTFLFRYYERTLAAKHQFIDLVYNEFASLIQS